MNESENSEPHWAKCVLHADLDAFFASVEQLDDPSLRGRPVLVGGASARSVVAAASYEARVFGCRSAMPMSMARAMCPAAIVREPRFERYAQLSRRFRDILMDQSPLVEAVSVDEAFVDVTGSQPLLGSGPGIARSIRSRVRAELGLTVSVGVATCKFVAKIASDMRKPDGLTIISPQRTRETLAPLPIERMWGVGPRTLPRFIAAGVRTFGDLQRMDEAQARRLLGDGGAACRLLALGVDEREVETRHERRSIGQEETFESDIGDLSVLREVLRGQCEQVTMRLRASHGLARCVSIKVRLPGFETFTRQRSLDPPTDVTMPIWRAADELLRAWRTDHDEPLRLLGMSVDRVTDAQGQVQPTLFPDPAEEVQRRIDSVSDAIARKFGRDALHRGLDQAPRRDP
jgi:DNA polymerase-4